MNDPPGDLSEHVVAGLLVRGRRVLLAHRQPTRRWCPDAWDVPGGHVLPGEDPRDALVRELHEELGVHLAADHLGQSPDLVRVWPQWRWDLWVVPDWSGQPVNRAPAEHDSLAWVDAALVEAWDRSSRLAGPWVTDGIALTTTRR